MKILMVTNSCSKKEYEKICQMRRKAIIDPQQKFFELMIEGLSDQIDCEVAVMSALPVSASTVKRYIFKSFSDKSEAGALYYYLKFLNGKISRYITLMFSSASFVKKWIKNNKEATKWIVVDPLVPVIAIPAKRIAHKFGVKVAAVVTDIPTLATNMKGRKENFLKRVALNAYQRISDRDLKSYDAYIPLTKSINDVVNVQNNPYIVIEGFADSSDTSIQQKHKPYLIYAGGVYEKYGLKALVEAFIKLNTSVFELHIYGDGPYVEELKKIQSKYHNIKYMGCTSAAEVVKKEKEAYLLINPRPTDEEFAKYSFPSKTMEYLLSGTAVLSTRLPGIPDEYFEYMYPCDGYSSDDIYKSLKKILNYSEEEILKKGKVAHEWIICEKNNKVMSNRIYEFLSHTF